MKVTIYIYIYLYLLITLIRVLITLLTKSHDPLSTVNPRKLEHGFRMIGAGILYTLYLKVMSLSCCNFLASTVVVEQVTFDPFIIQESLYNPCGDNLSPRIRGVLSGLGFMKPLWNLPC